MAFPVRLDNLIAYCLQIAILASAGTLLAYAFRLRMPKVALIYWQVLLAACLLLPALQSWKHEVILPEQAVSGNVRDVAEAIMADTAGAALSAPPGFALPSVTDIVVIVFIGGFIGRLLWLAVGLFRLRLFLRRSRFIGAKDAGATLISCDIGARARFFVSDEINSPAMFGFLDPAIILPRSFTELSDACREAVLCHELLHVRRRDWAVILGEEIIRSMFWFHPAVWWLLSRIHLSREQLIDYEVVRLTGNRQPYLESLLEIARACGHPKAVPAPLFLRERHLVQRVALLLKEASMNRRRLVFSLIGIAILLTGTVCLASAWFPLTGEPVISRETRDAVQKRESIKPEISVQAVNPSPKPLPAMPGPAVRNAPKSTFLSLAGAPVLSPVPDPNQNSAMPVRQPIRVGASVQESKLLESVAPVYPELAKRTRVSGKVIMTINVDEQGYVSDIQVLSGHPLLSDAAVAAVKKWRYSPTLLNGEPVPVIATVTVMFALKDDNATVITGSQNTPPGPFAQFMATIEKDPSFGIISISMSPAGEAVPPVGGSFFPAQFDFDVESLHSLMKAGGWDAVRPVEEAWPSGVIARVPFAAYSFVLSEAGEISDVRKTGEIEIPGMEQELSRTRILAVGRRGSKAVPVNCTISFVPAPTR